MLDLRPATMNDSFLLFSWRNDPETRKQSKNTDPISQEEHARWMMFNVMQGYPSHLVMMADTDFGPVGVIRFDAERLDVMTYRAGITVAPKHRGRKLAFDMLDMALRFMPDCTIKAEIREDNVASRRIFERCGFVETGQDGDFIKYRRGHQ